MFIAKKEYCGSFEYFKVTDRETSTSYGYTMDEEKATKFDTEEKAKLALKKAGFNAHQGIMVVEI